MSEEKLAALDALANLVQTRHEEYIRRFDAIDRDNKGIADDVKSLLATRSFTHGVVKTALYVSTAVSTIVGLVIAFLRGPHH